MDCLLTVLAMFNNNNNRSFNPFLFFQKVTVCTEKTFDDGAVFFACCSSLNTSST